MENNKDKTKNIEKETALTVDEELERCKALAFYLIRLHRVAPEGRKQNRSQKQINKMSVSTVEYMVKNLDTKILSEYRSAIGKNKA